MLILSLCLPARGIMLRILIWVSCLKDLFTFRNELCILLKASKNSGCEYPIQWLPIVIGDWLIFSLFRQTNLLKVELECSILSFKWSVSSLPLILLLIKRLFFRWNILSFGAWLDNTGIPLEVGVSHRWFSIPKLLFLTYILYSWVVR